MALIKINNTAQAISDAEEIASAAVKINSVAESIEFILSEVKSYWEQTQQDAQTFYNGLEQNVGILKTIAECNKDFSQIVTKYAENQDKTGQNAVS